MFKLLLISTLVFGLLTSIRIARNIDDFLKENEPDDPLLTSLQVDDETSKKSDIRVKLERTNEIDNWKHAEYLVSAGLEF